MTMLKLSKTERQILEQLLAGKKVGEIALARGRSRKTVETQVWTLRHKVGVRTSIQLGAWAERHGIREAGPN